MYTSELVTLFDQLIEYSHKLSSRIQSNQQTLWVPLTADEELVGLEPSRKAGEVFEDYWYQNGQDGRETRSSFGLVAADDEMIELAKAINNIKDQLKEKVNELKKADKDQWLEVKSEINKRNGQLRESLHFAGLARLHLKQAWRHIPIIERTPVRIGFNWYNSGRSIQKISVEQAEKALHKMDTDSTYIKTQLSQLGMLPPSTPLAKVQNLAPVMRANIFFDDNELPDRLAMNVSLPVLFKAGPEGKLPEHNTPPMDPPQGRQRAVRSDRRIEDEPFLPSIRVHRYIEQK